MARVASKYNNINLFEDICILAQEAKSTDNISIECFQCNTIFSLKPWRIKERQKNGCKTFYCSRECASTAKIGQKLELSVEGLQSLQKQALRLKEYWTSEKITAKILPFNANCKICDTPFRKSKKSKTKYCSQECYGKSKVGIFIPNNSHFVKGDSRVTGNNNIHWITNRESLKKSERGKNILYRYWAKSVKLRDGFICKLKDENCNGRLEAHHILNWVNNIDLRYEISNGITLCKFHHPQGRERENNMVSIFQEIIKNINE